MIYIYLPNEPSNENSILVEYSPIFFCQEMIGQLDKYREGKIKNTDLFWKSKFTFIVVCATNCKRNHKIQKKWPENIFCFWISERVNNNLVQQRSLVFTYLTFK